MNITEEQKQEAEKILKKYDKIVSIPSNLVNVAIQDRQSVLDEANLAFTKCRVSYDEYYLNRIQSLTNQIEYLKSKI